MLLGSGGQLGRSFEKISNQFNFKIKAFSRLELDISNSNELDKVISNLKPDFVINAGAYTNVDKAEDDQFLANKINNISLKKLSDYCRKNNSTLVHFSTDYVFDGTSEIPYKEEDETNPLNVYGKSKLNGEKTIISSGSNFLIIRTSWVYSEFNKNFLKTMLNITDKENIKIIDDQIGCPTYAPDIAHTTLSIIDKSRNLKLSHLYHYCGDNPCSWAEFAESIFNIAKKEELIDKIPKISKIVTKEYYTKAKRPLYSVLDCNKIDRDFDIKNSDWVNGIEKSIRSLKQIK